MHFSLPIVVVYAGGAVMVAHELPLTFLQRPTTKFSAFAREGVMRPLRVLDQRSTGKRIFGKELLAVTFEWAPLERYELQTQLVAAIDPA